MIKNIMKYENIVRQMCLLRKNEEKTQDKKKGLKEFLDVWCQLNPNGIIIKE